MLYATHPSAKGINCTECGSGIACESPFTSVGGIASVSSIANRSRIATGSKIACASKSIVWLILVWEQLRDEHSEEMQNSYR